jgi:hypothetical protein
METNWAAENLKTIRTLMERSALYRRALAPILIYVGCVGIVGGITGILLQVVHHKIFILYWLAVGVVSIIGAIFVARCQAYRDGELFWTPPTRRIVQAMIPSLLVGLVCSTGDVDATMTDLDFSIITWVFFYGLATHSAGFFLPREMRKFGWFFVIIGLTMMLLARLAIRVDVNANILMGTLFGVSHLAYGLYLHFTEKRKNEV